MGLHWVLLGLYWDNGKEDGNYYILYRVPLYLACRVLGLRVLGFGVWGFRVLALSGFPGRPPVYPFEGPGFFVKLGS